MFTKACEYGIRACVVVAQHSQNNDRISLKRISEEIASPEAFTAKILQQLVKHKIIFSTQGSRGGFEISPSVLQELTLADIIDAIDGNESYVSCVLGLENCSDDNPCPAHKKYKHIKAGLIDMIQSTTILEMVNDTENGFAFLKINK